LQASHCGGPHSIQGQSKWDMRWIEWYWDRTSVFHPSVPFNQSSILINSPITYTKYSLQSGMSLTHLKTLQEQQLSFIRSNTYSVKAKSKVHISHKKAHKFFVQNMLAFFSNTTICSKSYFTKRATCKLKN